MAKFLLLNGLGYVEFENSLDEEGDMTITFSSDEHPNVITQIYQRVSKHPLVLAVNGNPKSLYDTIIISKLNKVSVNNKIEENLRIDERLLVAVDPLSLLQDIDYNRPKKLAAFTHVFNEDAMLKLWIKYYGGIMGNENLYIINHGSTNDIKNNIPPDVNLISLPRGKCDHWNIAKYCAYFQRFLLTQYEWVIHTDCDEFLMIKDSNDFYSFLSKHNNVNLRGINSYDIMHDYINEPVLDYNNLILKQRKYMRECPHYHKCCITSRPATWAPGFHKSYENIIDSDEIWLLHLKYVEDKELHDRHIMWKNVQQTDLDKTFCNISASKFHNCDSIDEIRSYMPISENCVEMPDWVKLYL